MTLGISTLADRPDLAQAADDMPKSWPEFMRRDPVAWLYYSFMTEVYAEYILVAVDLDEPDVVIAVAHSAPFTWPLDTLPNGGWDTVVLRSSMDRIAGRTGDQLSAIEVAVRPEMQGSGLSGRMVAAMRDNAARLGFVDLVAPVRPSAKHEHPDVPMREYAAWTRPDGLPVDPWLRVHVRAGGVIEKVAPRSMTIAGTIDEWRSWTGLPFDESGPVMVPAALAPVHCSVEQDHAVYVEPNVWVRHRTT